MGSMTTGNTAIELLTFKEDLARDWQTKHLVTHTLSSIKTTQNLKSDKTKRKSLKQQG